MKILRTVAALATSVLSVSTAAGAEALWSAGVNAEQGWYDFNKSRNGAESELCWAITAANLIAWWQDNLPSGELPANTPTGESVWDIYRSSFSNQGSDPDQGMRWWLNGKYQPSDSGSEAKFASVIREGVGAYYTAKDGGDDTLLWKILYRGRGGEVTARTLSDAFYNGFSRGDAFWIGVNYYKPNGDLFMHALTVWGVEYEMNADGTPRITAIQMADSDDGAHCLHRIKIKEEAGMLKFDCPEHPLYGRIGDITITTYAALIAEKK